MTYDIKDHLGNVRVTFNDYNCEGHAEIIQKNSYYPFGIKIGGLSCLMRPEKNNYAYNGNELADEFGLNWYHYGARYYDPQLGRWHSIDPADEFHSPYAYCGNNPVMFVDPDGKANVYIHYGSTFPGVFLGHVGLESNGLVFSYGRYNESLSNPSGRGTLTIWKKDVYLEHYKHDRIKVFNIKYNERQENSILQTAQAWLNDIAPYKVDPCLQYYLDEYEINSNNCGTKAVELLPDGFYKSFLEGFKNPYDLKSGLDLLDIFSDQINQTPDIPPEE